MKIWLYCLTGVEDDLMPYFMNHYAPVCDKLVMIDGGMSQVTRKVIESYANAEIHDSPFDNTHWDDHQGNAYFMAKYQEARGHADYVIMVDADEFLYTGKPLRESIEEYKAQGIRAVQSVGVLMMAREFPPYDGTPLVDKVRMGVYDRIYSKTALFDPELWVRWSIGRHSAAISGYQQVVTGLKLLHYRYFGEEWLRKRNEWLWNRRSDVDKAMGIGYQSDPENEGKYSARWYNHVFEQAVQMVGV